MRIRRRLLLGGVIVCGLKSLGCAPVEVASSTSRPKSPQLSPLPSGGQNHGIPSSAIRLLDDSDRSPENLMRLALSLNADERSVVVQFITEKLLGTSGDSAEDEVGRLLESLRVFDTPTAPELESHLLSLTSPLFAGRRKSQALRLRAFSLVTLVETSIIRIPVPEILRHLYSYSNPYEFASGARCTRSICSEDFLPALINGLDQFQHHGDLQSLDRYSRDYPDSEVTTCQLESIRGLGAQGRSALEAIPMLHRLKDSSSDQRSAKLMKEVDRAIQLIKT